MQRLRVGYLSSQNYLDKNAWSGSLYHMHQALSSRNVQVVNLGEPKKPSRWQHLLNRVFKKNNSYKLGSPQYIAEYTKFADKVHKQLIKMQCDVIFAPVASAELTFIETQIPIIYLSDATFSLYEQYYQLNLDKQESEWASKQESIAISKASRLVYSSEWAANSAVCDYQADESKIQVIPFGANLDTSPLAEEVLSKTLTLPCRLLFVGKDWERKGGEIAFKTFISLRNRGIDAELVVVGSVPPADIKHEKLTVIPYLNKNIPQQKKQLDELFLKSHFFVFPTRADFSPIVICEANAFGLPVLTTDGGGIRTLVKNGENGYMLPLSASSDDYAGLIAQLFSDKTSYEQLVRSSRKEYEMRLNWNKWAESMDQLIMNLLDSQSSNR
ncbi:MAG TPA: glycosyltransferase family 4 protein [Coleofasciculaceae cyanobacterium]|jgi:glycosyltransferase involved in cell wall biosynthesis